MYSITVFTLDFECVIANTSEGIRTGEAQLTISHVRIPSLVLAMTHSKSRINAVIKYILNALIASNIKAGCKTGRGNISCWCDGLFRRYYRKTVGQGG